MTTLAEALAAVNAALADLETARTYLDPTTPPAAPAGSGTVDAAMAATVTALADVDTLSSYLATTSSGGTGGTSGGGTGGSVGAGSGSGGGGGVVGGGITTGPVAEWEWRAYDLASGAPLGLIEMADWSHTDILDDAGSWTATMAGRSSAIRRDYLTATMPGRSVIVPIRNGVPLGFAGIVWSRDAPRIAGAGLLSYFDRQPLNTRKAYVASDQHSVIKDLIDWVQTNGGNIGVDTSQVTLSGVVRTQTWEKWEEKNVGEAIRQKGDNLGGFDFDVRVEYDAGVLVRRLRLWTPRRGRSYLDAQASPTFRLDGRRGNVRDVPSVPVDATKLSTNVYAKGQEIDSTTHEVLLAESVRTDLLAAGWPRLGEVQTFSDIKDSTTLQQHADGIAYLYGPTDVDEIVLTVDPDGEPWQWGTWDLGDDCAVYIPPGDAVPWMPDGYADIRRVKSHEWSWSPTTGESLKVHTGRLLGA